MEILLWLKVQVLQKITTYKLVFFHQKEDFIRENVFKKDFFHGFANFSISENIQKFTLFRKVLLPLNEKYSGLRMMTNVDIKIGIL